MIRINLLASERERVRKPSAFPLQQKVTVVCSLIVLLAAVLVGWRYWTLQRDSKRLDDEIAAAEQETVRLRSILQQVRQFDERRAQLQQRVSLIEQLRQGQTVPVHLLDEVSRALPAMLWLTELKQTDDSVVISGECLAVTTVSDFVSNLEATGYFKKSIEIVSSQTVEIPTPPRELIRFQIKAQFRPPAEPPAPKQGA
jgi:type IV pilus assembly protein PilN